MKKSKHNGAAGRVIVVGAGASGMMAAGRAAEMGAEVLLLEKTERTGKKSSSAANPVVILQIPSH
ncbi:MAG: NAD(P)/FAD-dependent oxidoreductase [Syntrophales bacterium]|nr:NAD(P)/FAD-dependent oxidoreductase [Syntrophales bacterium]